MIIGPLPDRIRCNRSFGAGESIVIEYGWIRPARAGERGAIIPEDGAIFCGSDYAAVLRVPPWWWRLRFGETLRSSYPAERCCFEGGQLEHEQCGDCPL